MQITAFGDAFVSPSKQLGVFSVQFNPNQFTRRYANRVTNQEAVGEHATKSVNMGTTAEEMTFEFLFDGTGVTPAGFTQNVSPSPSAIAKQQKLNKSSVPGVVEDMVQQFLSLTYTPTNETHEPPYLILSWGILHFICKLRSADVNYTLFDPAGRPIRAKVNATFVEHNPQNSTPQKLNFRSPDLTRFHAVEEGETLHQLSERVYEDPQYYLELARVNQLNHFRKLRTGASLRMPPLKTAPDQSSSS